MSSAQTIWFSVPLSPLKTALVSGPSEGVSSRVFEPAPLVELQDAWGTVVRHTEVAVTASILGTSIDGRQSLVYSTRLQTRGGVVSFPSLIVTASGKYLVKVESWGLAPDVSHPFHVSEGGFSHLSVTRQPSRGVGGRPLRNQPIVTLRDEAGNTLQGVTGRVSISVELLSESREPATRGALMFGSGAASVLFGVASLTNVTVGPAGTYVLRFVASQAPTLGVVNASVLSSPFSVMAGKPSALSLVSEVRGCIVKMECRNQPIVQVVLPACLPACLPVCRRRACVMIPCWYPDAYISSFACICRVEGENGGLWVPRREASVC